ncbi:cell division cycle protein 16 homolog isoform X2 [Artemia franciscana]|uniref:cell division cycle protein 16 homolog isoform X2 n=1 Tax=Artemia franciscana TaxID=6661 RepID=UPI0032DAB991
MLCHTTIKFQFATAFFWAEKAATLSNNSAEDIYNMAKALFLDRQFKRAAYILENSNFYKTSSACFHLLMRALDGAKDYMAMETCFEIVNIQKLFEEKESWFSGNMDQIRSGILFLKAKCEIYLGRRQTAADTLIEAVKCDPMSFESLEAIIDMHLTSKEKIISLLEALKSNNKFSDSLFLFKLLTDRLRRNPKEEDSLTQSPLANSSDVTVNEAERLLNACAFKDALEASQLVLKRDQLHPRSLLISIVSLAELKKKNELFVLAHRLIDTNPHCHIAWFAVGCYYYLLGKSDVSRRFLEKSTYVEPNFGLAMLVQGHSFASDGHHDQAMASYFKAAKLIPNCHLPTLYVGVEYGLTNNPVFAAKFFNEAYKLCKDDPFVLHEYGVAAYQTGEYETAKVYFLNAISKIDATSHTCIPETWEPLYNNMGHVCRKLENYEESLSYHKKALMLKPRNGSTYTAIGLVQALLRQFHKASDSLHKALSFKRDDSVATSMLNIVLDMTADSPFPIEGIEEVPSVINVDASFCTTAPKTISELAVDSSLSNDDIQMDMSGS